MKQHRPLFYPQCRKKLITILIPCKDREKLTRDCLEAINQKTFFKKNIQVITITDIETPKDQNMVFDIYNSLKDPFPLISICRKNSDHINRDYYNFANLLSHSYFSWVIGNDVIIETQDWDKILFEKTKHLFPQIENDEKYFYIHIDDDTHVRRNVHKNKGNCFPILSNNFSYKFRGPMPEHNLGWGADGQIMHIINNSDFEIVDLINEIKVSHICPHNGKMMGDHITKLMSNRKDRDAYDKIKMQSESNFNRNYLGSNETVNINQGYLGAKSCLGDDFIKVLEIDDVLNILK